MAIDECNERATWISTVAFTDEDDEAVTPSSALYRIDDVGSNTNVRANTAIGSLDTSIEITWTEDDTAILNSALPYETRKLTIWYEYPSSKQGNKTYLLNIKNLTGITTTSPA